jgi:hypothetical protein
MRRSFVVVEMPDRAGAVAVIAPSGSAASCPHQPGADKGPRGLRNGAAYSPVMPPGAVAARLVVGAVERMDGSWPPVLVYAVVAVALGAIVAVVAMFRRLRAAARDQRLRPRGWER